MSDLTISTFLKRLPGESVETGTNNRLAILQLIDIPNII